MTTTLRIRLLEGSVIQQTFSEDVFLSTVCDFILDYVNSKLENNNHVESALLERYNCGIRLSVTYPRKLYDAKQIKSLNLQQAGLVPTASLIIESDELNGYRKPKPKPETKVPASTFTLRKESKKEIEEFKERQRLKEIEEMEREKIEKRRIIDGLRKEIEADKKERQVKRFILEQQKLHEQEKKRKRSSSDANMPERPQPKGKCVINVRTLHGKIHTIDSLAADDTLYDLHRLLRQKGWLTIEDDITFVNTGCMPRKEFEEEDFEDITIQDAELAPNGSVSILRASAKGIVKQGNGEMRKRKSRGAPKTRITPKRTK
jgi:hypothetical protein